MGNTLTSLEFGLWRKAGTRPRLARGEFSFGVDGSELDRTITQLPSSISDFGERDRLADERLADKDQLTAPLDLAILADPAHLVIGGIFGFTQPSAVGPQRRVVVPSRGRLSQRFVRSLLIEDTAKGVKPALLLAQGRRRRAGGVLLQRQMHPLVSAILLWLTRHDPLGSDASLDQPHCQTRQATCRHARERRSIIRT